MSTSLRLLNIVYTNKMEESVNFYEKLGLFRREDGEINQWWNEFPIGDVTLALHWHQDQPLPIESNPELHIQASSAEFDAIYLALANMNPSDIGTREGLGRNFTVVDPNGIRLQLDEAK